LSRELVMPPDGVCIKTSGSGVAGWLDLPTQAHSQLVSRLSTSCVLIP
jgi:hypothetical protein